jgi:hypothetical protein
MRGVASLSRVKLIGVYVRRASILMLCAGMMSGLGGLGVAPAVASCAADPAPSAYAFEGTVIATSENDRVAEVVMDSGERVTVRGAEDSNWFSNSESSVDRRFALGGRYVFHPLNNESPFEDNSCTATRQLSGPSLTDVAPRDVDGVLPAWLPVDEQAGPIGYMIVFGPIAIGLVLLVAGLRRVTRRRGEALSSS